MNSPEKVVFLFKEIPWDHMDSSWSQTTIPNHHPLVSCCQCQPKQNAWSQAAVAEIQIRKLGWKGWRGSSTFVDVWVCACFYVREDMGNTSRISKNTWKHDKTCSCSREKTLVERACWPDSSSWRTCWSFFVRWCFSFDLFGCFFSLILPW